MNILSTQYTLSNKALEIYISGCSGNPHCRNCHNPLSWDFKLGDKYNSEYNDKIVKKVQDFSSMIENIMIFGGEPLDQDYNDLEELLINLDLLGLPIWLFTRYNIDSIPSFVKEYVTYIKCGRYDEDCLIDNNIQYEIKLATSNQNIYKKGIDY